MLDKLEKKRSIPWDPSQVAAASVGIMFQSKNFLIWAEFLYNDIKVFMAGKGLGPLSIWLSIQLIGF